MQLSKEQVKRLAHLARLKLTEKEIEQYQSELGDILSYVEIIKELNTEGVPETSQVTGLSMVSREDEARGILATPDELLDCSPLLKLNHQIRIQRIL